MESLGAGAGAGTSNGNGNGNCSGDDDRPMRSLPLAAQQWDRRELPAYRSRILMRRRGGYKCYPLSTFGGYRVVNEVATSTHKPLMHCYNLRFVR